MIRQELESAIRVIQENEFSSPWRPMHRGSRLRPGFCPEAQLRFENMPTPYYGSLAECCAIFLPAGLGAGFPAYNLVVHTSPLGEEINDHYHWHIEMMPKLTKVAGFEWGTGFYINPTPPEESAVFREAR